MDQVFDLGIRLVLFFQSLGEWLVGPAKFFTFLGSEDFFLLIAPAIYWCLDSTVGLRVGVMLMLNGGINDILKVAFQLPRPYWYDPAVRALSTESSFGLPSGHSQTAVVVWGILAASIRKTWAWIAALLIILLIGFSRMYLAVHFPSDVLLGWLIGGLVLWAGLRLEGPVRGRFARLNLSQQVGAVLAVSLAMILVGVLVRLPLSAWVFPAEWSANIFTTTQSAEPVNPGALAGLITNAAGLFGLVLGALLVRKTGGFDARGPWEKRGLRFLVGLVGVLLIWRGLGSLLPSGENLVAYIFRYLRYSLIGLWVSGLAPMLFIRFGLAEKSPGRQERGAAAYPLPS